jgi:peptide/nickel transport system substrate-binding protein
MRTVRTWLAASALAMAAGTAAAQDAITVAMQLEPPNLDPTAGAAEAIDSVVYLNVFEGLTRFTSEGSVVPHLAEDWEVSEDGLVYTFRLRDGVSFHDGSTFDAEDVKFSLDRARSAESTNAQKTLFAQISDVQVIDPLTVQVTLSQPNGALPFNLAWGDAVIVAPETADANATNPVGTGPFRFGQWVQGDRVELVRSETYWGEAPALERATFRFISDPSAAFAAVLAGDVDVFAGYPAPENLAQFQADPTFQVLVGSTEGETILAMNNSRPPFDNHLVRQAVSRAIDRQAIIDGAMFGYGTPVGSHFAPHSPAYLDLTEQSSYDPDRARELLADAGFPEGFETTLRLPPPAYARRGGEILASQLREVGIEAEIMNVEWAQWIEEVFTNRNFDLTIVSHTEPMDIGIYANPDYYFGYDSPEFREIMADLTAATDDTERTRLLQAAQQRIADDAVNAFLFQLPALTVAKAGVQGLWPNAPVAAMDLAAISWAE